MQARAMLVRYGRKAGEVRDNFDDRTTSGGGPLQTTTGQTWHIYGPNEAGAAAKHGVITGTAYTSATDTNVALIDAGFTDGRVQMTFTTSAAATTLRMYARASDMRTTGFNAFYVASSGTNWTLNKRVFGSNSNLGTYAVTPVDGDIATLVLRGASLEFFLNGTSRIGPVTDGWNLGATLFGYAILSDTLGRVDTFSVTRV